MARAEPGRMLCIFCLQEKPERTGAGEHPIPLAVGGSWTINRVCEECDSRFGHTHDARLSEVTKISERRETLGLSGNSGTVPSALKKALSRPVTVVDAPHHRMMVKKAPDGTFETKTIPNIDFDITVRENGECFVALNPDTFVLGMMPREEAQELLARRLGAAITERGLTFEDDVVAAAAEKVVNEIEVFERPITEQVTRKIITGGHIPSLLKVAYEAAWYWLGDEWLSDPEAQRMRKHLLGDESVSVTGNVQEGEHLRLNVEPTDRAQTHVIYLFKTGNKLVVEVQLFDLYTAGFVITTAPEKYNGPSTTAIVMDAVKGTYREVPLQALLTQ